MIAGEDYSFDGNARYFDPATPILVTYHSLAKDSISESERTTSESQTAADWLTLGQNAYNAQNYTEAAEQGNAVAQSNIGLCYKKLDGALHGTQRKPSDGSAKQPHKATWLLKQT